MDGIMATSFIKLRCVTSWSRRWLIRVQCAIHLSVLLQNIMTLFNMIIEKPRCTANWDVEHLFYSCIRYFIVKQFFIHILIRKWFWPNRDEPTRFTGHTVWFTPSLQNHRWNLEPNIKMVPSTRWNKMTNPLSTFCVSRVGSRIM